MDNANISGGEPAIGSTNLNAGQPGGQSGFSARPEFGAKPQPAKNPGGFFSFLGNRQKVREQNQDNLKKNPFEAARKKIENEKKPDQKRYFAQSSEQLGKFGPALAPSWKTALPDSFATKDKAKQTMGRVLGAKGDAWVSADKMRQIEKAVKEQRWGHDSLKGLKSDELKGLKYDSKKRSAFISGIRSLNEKKF